MLFSVATRRLIEEIGKSSYIAVSSGFWYEYSLAMPANYGIDFDKRHCNMYDDGKTAISTSTWPQVGRAVASILSLPIKAEADAKGANASLEGLRNKVIYINSFTVSQQDMLESAQRVTGTKPEDWSVEKYDSRERFSVAMKFFKEGKFKTEGFTNFLYSRIFFPDGCGDTEHNKGTVNALLGLPKEDLDEATRVAMERQQSQGTNGGH